MKEGWEIKTLGDICCKKQQIERAAKKHSPSDSIVYIDISAIDSSTNNVKEPTTLSFQDAPSRAQQVVKKDDILVSLVRPNLRNIAQINDDRNNLVASSGFCVLRTKENSRYLKYVVLGKQFTDYLISRTSGANYPAVREDDIKEYSIPVPSIAEQEKIVAELDCLSGIIEKKKQQLKEYDALAQSIFYEMFGDPIDNEKGWAVKSLGEVCDVRDGTHDSPKYLEQSDFVLITSKNIVSGTIDFTTANYISEEDYININKRSCVDEGDIIMAMIGTIGNPIIVKNIDRKFCIKNVALIKFANSSLVTNVYIRALLDNKSYCQYILSQNKGGTQKFVALGTIRKLKTPLPPLALQQKFASKIEAIEKQKALIKKSIEEVETLFNSRMDYYFN